MKPHVYIFRGGPASGKGTIVPEFAKLLPKPVALIELDKLRWGFHLIGRDISQIKDEEHLIAYRNTLLIYEQYIKNGHYNIVLEGLFTWDNSDSSQGSARELINLAEQYGLSCTCIVLRAEKNELLKRNAGRDYSVPEAEFNMLYDNVYQKIHPSEILIDSTGLSIEETLDKLNKAM